MPNPQRGELISLAKALADETLANGSALTIQVLRAGDFEDMHGKEFALTSADLDAYIANSNALLEREEIPVEIGHPNESGAPASAWYRKFFKKVVDGVEWICAEIELTALGADSLSQKLYKYFSAVIDLDTREIFGGGFVNRPAVSGQQPVGSLSATIRPKGATMTAMASTANMTAAFISSSTSQPALIRLLQRALGIAKLEMSQEDKARKLWDALREKYGDPLDEYAWNLPWIEATYDDRVIVKKDGEVYSIAYSFDGDEVTLDAPIKVEVEYVPAETANADVALAQTVSGGQTNMSQTNTTPAQAPAAIAASVPAATVAIPATNPLPVPQIDSTLPVDEQLRLAREQAHNAAMEQQRAFSAELERVRREAWENAQLEMTRRQNVAALAQRLTSGARQLPFTPQALEDVLAKLSDADREIIAPVLEKIQSAGLVNMGEIGSSGQGKGHRTLAAYALPLLRAWLDKKGTVAEFFAANPELGTAEQYDLSEFEKK